MLHLAMVLFLASPPAAEPVYVRLDLSPSGSQVAIGEPVIKGGMLAMLGRNEYAAEVMDQVVARFGEATEPALRELVLTALGFKAELDRDQE